MSGLSSKGLKAPPRPLGPHLQASAKSLLAAGDSAQLAPAFRAARRHRRRPGAIARGERPRADRTRRRAAGGKALPHADDQLVERRPAPARGRLIASMTIV